MDILLDTCSVLQFLNGEEKMPTATRNIILNTENTIYVSIATVWEVAIKLSIEKLDFDGGIDGFINALDDENFSLLEISKQHVTAVASLLFIHRDPFDRMLVAQAMVEKIPIMTTDSEILKYDISHIWNSPNSW